MSYNQRRRRNQGFNFKQLYRLLGLLSFLVIGISMWRQVSPDNVIKDAFYSISGKSEKVSKNASSYHLALAEKDSLIANAQKALDECQNKQIYRIGIIDIESETVNVRSKASLVSDIILQIPNGSEVQILYFDTEKFYLDGIQGKWCRIIYAGQEGWVWGNFVRVPQ